MGKTGLEHTVNLTPAGSGSTKNFLMSYKASGLRPGNISGAVYSRRLGCNFQPGLPPLHPGKPGHHRAKLLHTRGQVFVLQTTNHALSSDPSVSSVCSGGAGTCEPCPETIPNNVSQAVLSVRPDLEKKTYNETQDGRPVERL